MRTVIGRAFALALAGGAASGAIAADRNATAAIVSGNYAQAEQTLSAERRIFPSKPELMLNLAAVYRQTGRHVEARALYADVLARDDQAVDLVNQQTVSSHALARASLARLTQVASR